MVTVKTISLASNGAPSPASGVLLHIREQGAGNARPHVVALSDIMQIMLSGQPDPGTIALANAVKRRLPRLVANFHDWEPLLSRAARVSAEGRTVRVPVDLGTGAPAYATYDLVSLCSGFCNSDGFAQSLENSAYFNLAADRLAELIMEEHSVRTQTELYGEERSSNLIGLSGYAPSDTSDEWIGGLSPELPGWQPQVTSLSSTDAAATVAAVFDLSLACTEDLSEPTLIAAGHDVAFDVLRGFQTQQRFWSSRRGVGYLHVGFAEMFWAPSADRNAAFVLHPDDFALHHTPPLVTASGGHLVARVDQQLVCSRRRMVGRLQRHAGLHI